MLKGAVIVVAVVIVAAGGFLFYEIPSWQTSHSQSSSSSESTPSSSFGSTPSSSSESTTYYRYSTCSGYPPGGDCLGVYNYTFTIYVNYTGSWRLTYNGTNNVGESDAYSFNKTLSGAGNFAVSVPLSGMNNQGLETCAKAQKLDSSNSTLVLTLEATRQTSLPYGSTSICATVVP